MKSDAIVRALDTYTEISPSGTGLHLLAYGELPEGGRKNGMIEMYDSGRFITITARPLPDTPIEINPRKYELSKIHAEVFGKPKNNVQQRSPTAKTLSDTEILSLAGAAGNGSKFRSLYEDGSIGDYNSHSEGDLALCNILSFWT